MVLTWPCKTDWDIVMREDSLVRKKEMEAWHFLFIATCLSVEEREEERDTVATT